MIDLSSRRVWVPDDDDDGMKPLEAPHPRVEEDLHTISFDFLSLNNDLG